MPKMKTNRGLSKRVRKTGTGKLKIKHAYTGHLARNKTHKQKVHLRKDGYLDKSDYVRIKDML